MQKTDPSLDCLIIFTRNPELGKGKRRLAADVGDEAALEIYKFLLDHTRSITKNLNVTKQVWYSERVHLDDDWDNAVYEKYAQQGDDLGARMHHAISEALKTHDTAIIIGSDLYDLSQEDLEYAFAKARQHKAVIGPAEDGGYYLLGFRKNIVEGIFEDKKWGSDSVLEATLADLKQVDYYKFKERNDVDYVDDIAYTPAFQPFLKNYHAN
ncbi:glycosyltransferase [Nonlabens spongiae]|uniref:Glycosyltransferase n=1 Tax=Nonlabens spongiae TaxID=331648 RepID=A0A1W6MM64_9FLAO|nr:TIGR04282 family arsenosugar biosynthesis glycosyltransferase [Nonlabens spongiae]ARN78690.1 glycosyltransferase [Nonlabens spongiae]